MRNKFLCFIISVIMLIQFTNVVYADSNNVVNIDEAIGLFTNLGLIEEIDGVNFDNEKSVTRAEYVDFWFNFMNPAPVNNVYYYDVPSDHWAFSQISTLSELGYIMGCGDKKFNPDETMTVEQAAVVAVRILGLEYMVKEFNKSYIQVAYEQNILDGISVNNSFTKNQMYKMVFNAITEPIYAVSSINNKNVEITQGDDTLLSKYRDIYFDKGTVYSINQINMYSVNYARDGYITINNESYEYSLGNEKEWIGQSVKFFYKKSKNNDDKSIVYLYNTGRNKTLDIEILEKNAYNSKNGILTYDDEKGKTKTVKISQQACVIYNGEVTDKLLEDVFAGEHYYVRLISVQNENDLVFVEEMYSVLVERVDTENKIIYDKINPSRYICLDEDDYEKINYYSSDGRKISFGDVNKGSVISVAKSFSGKIMYVYVSSDSVVGSYQSQSTEEPYYLYKVSGEKYKALSDISTISSFASGDDVTLYLDWNKYVVYIDAKRKVDFGYALSVVLVTDDGDEDYVSMEMYIGGTEFTKMKLRPKINIDGNKLKTAEATYNYLGRTEFSANFVAYKKNEEGVITSLDFAKLEDNSKRTVDDMFVQHTPVGSIYLDKYEKKWGLKTRIGADTIAFGIPSNKDYLTNPKKYCVCSGSKIGGGNYNGTSFSYGLEDSEYADVVLVNNLLISGDAELTAHRFIVDKIEKCLNEDDQRIDKVYGYFGNSYRFFETDPDFSCEELGIKKGCAIFVDRDNGYINDTTIIEYDPSKPEKRIVNKNRMDRQRDTMVYVNDVVGTSIKGGFESGANYDELFTTYYAQILLYDSKTDTLRKADLSEIRTYKLYGNNCDSVYTYVHATEFPYNFVIYR